MLSVMPDGYTGYIGLGRTQAMMMSGFVAGDIVPLE